MITCRKKNLNHQCEDNTSGDSSAEHKRHVNLFHYFGHAELQKEHCKLNKAAKIWQTMNMEFQLLAILCLDFKKMGLENTNSWSASEKLRTLQPALIFIFSIFFIFMMHLLFHLNSS